MPNWNNQGGADSTWGTGTLNNTSSSSSIKLSYAPEQLANIAGQALQLMPRSPTSTPLARLYEHNHLMGTTTTFTQTPADFAVTTISHGRRRTWIHTSTVDPRGRHHTSTVRLFRNYHHHHRYASVVNNTAAAPLPRTPAYLAGEAHHYMVRKRLGSPVPDHYLPAGFAPLPGDAHAAHVRHLASHNKRKAQWRQKVRLEKYRLEQPRMALQQQESLATATTTTATIITAGSTSNPTATVAAPDLEQGGESDGGEASQEESGIIRDEPGDDGDDNDNEPEIKTEVDSDDDFDFSALHPPYAFHMDGSQNIPVPSIEQDDDASASREPCAGAGPEINNKPHVKTEDTTESPAGPRYPASPEQLMVDMEEDEDLDAPWSPGLPVSTLPVFFAGDGGEDGDETVIKVEPGTQDFFAADLAPASPAPFVPASPALFVPASPEPYIPASPTRFIPTSPAPFVPETPTPVVLASPAPLAPYSPAPVGPTAGVSAAAGPLFESPLPPYQHFLQVSREEPNEWLGQMLAWLPAPLPEYPSFGNHMVHQSSMQSVGAMPYSHDAFGYEDALMGEPEPEAEAEAAAAAEPSDDQEEHSDSTAMVAEFDDDSSGEEGQSLWINLTPVTFPVWWEQHGMAVETISLVGASDGEDAIMGNSETEAGQESGSESTTIVAESDDSEADWDDDEDDIDWGDEEEDDDNVYDNEPNPGISPDRGSDSDGPGYPDTAYEAQTGVHSIEVEHSEYGRALAKFYEHSDEQYWADDEGGDAFDGE